MVLITFFIIINFFSFFMNEESVRVLKKSEQTE